MPARWCPHLAGRTLPFSSEIQYHPYLETDLMPLPPELAAAAERAAGALRDFSVNVTGWRWTLAAPDDAARPEYDDSAWQARAAGEPWCEPSDRAWFRTRFVVPERLRGIPTAGRALPLALGIDGHGELFIDGKPQGTFARGDGRFTLTGSATPGVEHVLAIKVTSEEFGRLRFARLRVDGTTELEQCRNELLAELRRATQFLGHAQGVRPAWLDALAAALHAVEEAVPDLPMLPEVAAIARDRLAAITEAMATEPVFLAPPYLQNPTGTEVTIRWELFSPLGGHLEYRESIHGRPAKVELPAATLGRVRLAGLTPGRRYMYRLALAGEAGPWRHFETVAEGDSAVRFVVWGDNQSHPEVSEPLVRLMAGCGPDLAVSVGDLVGHGGNWPEWVDHYLWPIRELAANVPTYVAIGNHDYGGFWETEGPKSEPFEHYLEHPASPGSPYWYSFDRGPARFVVLDNNRRQDKIEPGCAQYEWLQAELAAAQEQGKWIFVFIHEPPFSECWSGGYYDGEPGLREHLVPLLERYGAAIVFSGHTHDYERGLPHPPYDPADGSGNTVSYIITGGGGGGLDDHKYYEWPQIDLPEHGPNPTSDAADGGLYYWHHFCLVEVDGDRLRFTAHAMHKDGRYAGILDQFELRRPGS